MSATLFWSASAGAFFDAAIHDAAAMPADAVRISAARHAQLLAGQGEGRRIVSDARGRPQLARSTVTPLARARAEARRRIRTEEAVRILAIARPAAQANDISLVARVALALALGSESPHPAGLDAALARMAAIEAVHARSNALQAEVARLGIPALEAFAGAPIDWES